MAQWIDVPLPTQDTQWASAFASPQDVKNMLFDTAPDGEARRVWLKHSPGYAASHETAEVIHAAAPWNGHVISVRGTNVYATEMGVSDTDIGNMTAGSGPYLSAATGDGVVFVNSTASILATETTVTAITPPAGTFSAVAYQDGYTVYARAGTDEFYVSALDDPTTIGALDFSTADALPGNIVGLISDHRELVIFKENSIEFWSNTGGTFPFARQTPGLSEHGCASAAMVCKYDGSIFFAGADGRIYRLTGYAPVRVSPPWMDATIVSELSTARASVVTYDGRSYYAIHMYSGGVGWWYDIELGVWATRSSTSINRFVDVFNMDSSIIAGALRSAGATGGVGVLSKSYYKDSGESSAAARSITLPTITAGPGRAVMTSVVLEMKKQAAAGDVSLSFSDDGGATFSAAKSRDGTLARLSWARLGRFARRVLRFSFATESALAITAVHASIEPTA